MIWQEIVMNGQQRPVAIPTILVSIEEVITATAAIARVIAATAVRPVPAAAIPSAHFYTCNTEC